MTVSLFERQNGRDEIKVVSFSKPNGLARSFLLVLFRRISERLVTLLHQHREFIANLFGQSVLVGELVQQIIQTINSCTYLLQERDVLGRPKAMPPAGKEISGD